MNFDSIPWTLVKLTPNAENDGGIIFVRFRQFPPDFPRDQLPIRLNVFWTMSEPNSQGHPTDAEAARSEVFENRLVDAVEQDSSSLLTVVLTGNGQREFVFHTADDSDFLRRLNEMPQEPEQYPIKIVKVHDPAWDYFDQVTGPILDT